MRRAELRLTKGGKSRWNLAFAAMRAALLLSSLTVACAPSVPKVSFWPSANVAPRRGPTASSSSSREALVIGAIAGAACAAVAAIGSTKRKVHYNASSSDAGGPKFYKPPQYSKDDEESDTAEVYPSDLEEDIEEPEHERTSGQPGAGKLWTRAQFPEGRKGPANWDLQNLAAAQGWACPCPDQNCLSRERYPRVDPLYEFRKDFQTKSKGLRDTFREKILEPAFNATTGNFSRSCRIGDRNDNCVAAGGMAAGLSFATFANARADVTKSRPYHKGRVRKRDHVESKERSHLHSYIRDLRSTMEGSKGAVETKWFTGKRSGALPPSPSCVTTSQHMLQPAHTCAHALYASNPHPHPHAVGLQVSCAGRTM